MFRPLIFWPLGSRDVWPSKLLAPCNELSSKVAKSSSAWPEKMRLLKERKNTTSIKCMIYAWWVVPRCNIYIYMILDRNIFEAHLVAMIQWNFPHRSGSFKTCNPKGARVNPCGRRHSEGFFPATNFRQIIQKTKHQHPCRPSRNIIRLQISALPNSKIWLQFFLMKWYSCDMLWGVFLAFCHWCCDSQALTTACNGFPHFVQRFEKQPQKVSHNWK